MKITEHVFSKKMQFQSQTPNGVLTRSAYVFLVTGAQGACLIDAGIAPLRQEIIGFATDCGQGRGDIKEILITHAHADHMGALRGLQSYYGCPVAASARAAVWIEDVERQFRERPVPRFHELVEGSVKVDRTLADGDRTELGGSTLMACAVPGHDPGQLAFFHEQDGVLFSADSIPIPGEMPIYEDAAAEARSLCRMRALPGVRVLLMSWADAITGEESIRQTLDDALAYMRQIHQLTMEGAQRNGAENLEAVAQHVHAGLGLPASEFTGMFIGTVRAHLSQPTLGTLLDEAEGRGQ